MRFRLPVALPVVLLVVVLVGALASLGTPGAGAAPLPDGACRYVTAISESAGTTPDQLAQVAVPGSDAYAYGVFEDDVRDAWAAAQEDPTRTVRCGSKKIEVDLLQQPRLPISEPKRITTTYRGFTVDASGRVETFSVNGTPIAGRVLVGSGPPAVALGTTVTVSSAYRVPRGGGEHIRATNSLVVAVRATAPADGFRDLATGATTYETGAGKEFVAHVVGQGSGIPPGASAVWALDFDARQFGGTLTVPVVTKPSAQVGPTDPLEAAVLTVD